jgi:hypothetical protein
MQGLFRFISNKKDPFPSVNGVTLYQILNDRT